MRKCKRLLVLVLALVTVMSCMLISAQAAWKKDSKGWYYVNQQGKRLTNTWQKDSKGWVYLDANGYMVTNKWVRDSVGWCYVGADGYAVTNCWKKDSVGWCYLNANGSMTKNKWVKDGGKWYYLDANGYMVTNKWSKDSVGWVYCGADGAMLTNSWCKDSKGWCYVGADGYAVTNCWKKDSIGWIYLDANGSMSYNKWIKDGGKWYYVGATGYMVTGWQIIGGDRYYFYTSGVMAASTTVDGITLGADGKAQQESSTPEIEIDPNKPEPAPKNAKLSIGIAENALVQDYDTNALTKWLEAQTGYEIEFLLYSGNTPVSTQVSTTIAAGQPLPDILLGIDLNANIYGKDGYFVDLSNYYRDTTGASQAFWTRINSELSDDEIDQIMGAIIDPASGRIYSVPAVEKAYSQQLYQPYINQAWLDRLDLAMPTNINELYTVLKAFKEQDANGNGNHNDEIPLLGSSKVHGGDTVSWLINMYLYYDPSNPHQPYDYQDMAAGYADAHYREALAFVNKLYKEELLSPLALTATATEMRTIVSADICGIFLGNLDLVMTQDSAILYDYAALPLWGYAVTKPLTVKANTYITADCDDPSAAFKVLMALWSEEGSARMRYGEYGVNWTDADPDAVSAYGLEAKYKVVNDPWGQPNTANWTTIASCFLPYADGENVQTTATGQWDQYKAQLKADTLENFNKAVSDNNPYFQKVTSALRLEDPQTASDIQNSLKTIVNRSQLNFVMGIADPMNDADWQAYLTELNNFGLADLLAQQQMVYQETWGCNSVLNHFFRFASCAEDGRCVFCNSTNAMAHGHRFEGGSCTICGSAAPTLTDGRWHHAGIVETDGEGGRELDRTYIGFDADGTGYISASFYSWLKDGLEDEGYWGGSYIEYDGEIYGEMGFGRGGDITYTVSGDTVTLRIESWGEYTGTMTLQKSGVDRYKVISIDGLVIDETVTDTIPIGSEFTWQ